MFSVTRKDLEISFFSGSGAGGQHRNKHMNCVRMRHPESGVMVTAQDHREKQANIKDALSRLAAHPKFRWFCEQRLMELEGAETAAKLVEAEMTPDKIETYLFDGDKFVSEKTGEALSPLVERMAQ